MISTIAATAIVIYLVPFVTIAAAAQAPKSITSAGVSEQDRLKQKIDEANEDTVASLERRNLTANIDKMPALEGQEGCDLQEGPMPDSNFTTSAIIVDMPHDLVKRMCFTNQTS